MKQALSHLLNDLLSAILFLAVYLATANITAGAAGAITVGLAQIAVQRFTGRRIWPMQLISLAVVVILSAASIATQSPRFVMLKPSLGHFAIAAAMLKRGWMTRYLPEVAQRHLPANAPVIAGYAWAGLMAVLGLTNILLALYAPFAIWVWFISVGAIGAKVAAFLLQYAVFRTIVRRARKSAEATAIGAVARASSAPLGVVAGLILLTSSGDAGAVGFQQTAAPNPQGQPFELDIWYPSEAPATPRPLGLFQQTVAADAPISGSQLPLIVISHGTGGGAETHYDTALALAEAGVIAAAVTHTGDNWRDHAYSFTARNFVERPRHIRLAIDYLLTAWSGRDHVAAERIGAFGHSAGGFTVLVAIGGNPELARLGAYCREHPDDWGCQHALARGPSGDPPAPAWVHDERVKAAVVAAPAAGHAFTAAGLAPVAAPVQLWEAEDDRIAPNRWSADNVKANLPSPPEVHLVPGAGHFDFLAPCSAALAERAPEICLDPSAFDRPPFSVTSTPRSSRFSASSRTVDRAGGGTTMNLDLFPLGWVRLVARMVAQIPRC
jgi:predicted dienelactone hydrolase/intracellular septation protein A